MGDMDFLTEIRTTEQQAAAMIDQAREQAQLRQEQARAEAALIISKGREEATRQQHIQLTAAEDEAILIKLESIKQAKADAQALVDQCANRLDNAVLAVAERIVNSDAHR